MQEGSCKKYERMHSLFLMKANGANKAENIICLIALYFYARLKRYINN